MLIVVDGGASRCRAAAYDERGARCAEVLIENHASLSLGVEAAAATVAQAVEATARRLDRPCGWRPGRLMFGLAGSLGDARRAAFLAAFMERPGTDARVDIITDGQAQLLGATGGRTGACVAVGTGSVVHWRDAHGTFGMGGGWGFPVGDEGSASWLGVRALRAWIAMRDRHDVGTRPTGQLFEALNARIGHDIGDIQRWTTCTVSAELGTLAPLVSQAAAAGDAVALDLLERGAHACDRLFSLAPARLPRWLVGGLADVYRPILERGGDRFEPVGGDALDGLHRFAASVDAQPSGHAS